LVERVAEDGGRTRAAKLAAELRADLTIFPAVLGAAEVLGLASSLEEEVYLTGTGLDFERAPKHGVKMLRDAIATIEPFRTALELVDKEGRVTASRVSDVLSKRGTKWHFQTETNESIIKAFLMDWAIPAGMLKYEKSGRFQKA
jgi:hypothetical protein